MVVVVVVVWGYMHVWLYVLISVCMQHHQHDISLHLSTTSSYSSLQLLSNLLTTPQ